MTDGAIQELLDKQALYELVLRFCRAVDRADEELLLSVYHDDAFDDHGSFKGGPVEYLEYLRGGSMNVEIQSEPLQHAITNAVFEIDGDVAYGESYVEVRRSVNGEVTRALGRYIDRYERRNGEWRIAHRRVLLESAAAGHDASDFTPWYRDRRDPSYEREPSPAPR